MREPTARFNTHQEGARVATSRSQVLRDEHRAIVSGIFRGSSRVFGTIAGFGYATFVLGGISGANSEPEEVRKIGFIVSGGAVGVVAHGIAKGFAVLADRFE